jgi:hypothetical protein
MMDFKKIAAAAALTVAIAAPAFAEPVARSASAQHRLQQEQMYRHAYGSYGYTGFWPGDVAAGIVGGAIGTAAALASAPFGAGPYARYNGPYPGERYYPSYAAPRGFTCAPGYSC